MNPAQKNAMADDQGAFLNRNQSRLQSHCSAPLDLVLSRLENVRQYGQGWRAKCPAHGGKSHDTLSLAQGDDGRVLIHCFHSCTPLEILHSIGLELTDLFPARITHNATPAERRELRELARQSQWLAALPALMSEANVVLVAAGMVDKGERLTAADDERLKLAIERIASARLVLNG